MYSAVSLSIITLQLLLIGQLMLCVVLIKSVHFQKNGQLSNLILLAFRELKDNLGNDEPEGDMPVLLQTLLSRNPKIFRDKSMPIQCKVWGGKEEMLSCMTEYRFRSYPLCGCTHGFYHS